MHLNESLTQELITWAQQARADASTAFDGARQIVTHLGAHYRNGHAEVGYWAPVLARSNVPVQNVYLEILTPVTRLDLRATAQTVTLHRERVPLMQDDIYFWGVIEGMTPGTRETIGSFYWLAYEDNDGWHHIVDPMAVSAPFGVKAPSEFYDMDRLQSQRPDREHFSRLSLESDPDGVMRVTSPINILQIHVGTATEQRTLEGLTQVYRTITHKLHNDEPLTPAEQNYCGYDAVQLMPIEPIIEYEAGPNFWNQVATSADGDELTVDLKQPDMTNWGYDVIMAAAPAVNPVLLGSGRPDELVDFIAALHDFPGKPIMAMFDIVYGHADNQSLPIMSDDFFAGPNMYGQNLDYLNPVVRAMLLEMQRRKSNFGIDGIRVDGAQDFKYYMPERDEMVHDDDYLRDMNDIVQDVAGVEYRPWMIFEDGRPWPRDDWELASTYREVTKLFPNVFQWGPLTFAHNTPFLFTFWISKWWRIREIAQVGSKWITGCANHDTLRRGTQVDINGRINTYLGESLPEIFKKAYDNPAANMLTYTCLPGVPMEFINALMRAPWSFIRNTDDRWAVKVVSEESRFLHWVVNEALYSREDSFMRMKAMGFDNLAELRRFLNTLDHLVQATEYNLSSIEAMMRTIYPPLPGPAISINMLKEFARAWMDDVYDYCNVALYIPLLDATQTQFNLNVREFRRARPWLMNDLLPQDAFNYIHPSNGSVLFYGLRNAPDGNEQVLFIANMEGAPLMINPSTLPIPDLAQDGWQLALHAPQMHTDAIAFDRPITFEDSWAVTFIRRTS